MEGAIPVSVVGLSAAAPDVVSWDAEGIGVVESVGGVAVVGVESVPVSVVGIDTAGAVVPVAPVSGNDVLPLPISGAIVSALGVEESVLCAKTGPMGASAKETIKK